MRSNPDAIEAALLQRAERSSQLSTEERTALADKLADAAMMHLRHSQELALVATKVRAGEV